MNSRTLVTLAAAGLIGCATMADAKVASISLQDLVNQSDAVVLAKVDRVQPLAENSVERYGNATVIEVWKGSSTLHDLKFLASPTWTCDISDAQPGETVVLFLIADRARDRYLIADAGRGRMPVRVVGDVQLATIWSDDVVLPEGTYTQDGPEPKYLFIRSISVAALKKLVIDSAPRMPAV